jgi:hypothetical protein
MQFVRRRHHACGWPHFSCASVDGKIQVLVSPTPLRPCGIAQNEQNSTRTGRAFGAAPVLWARKTGDAA